MFSLLFHGGQCGCLPEPEMAHRLLRESPFPVEASLVPDQNAARALRVRLLRGSQRCLHEALQPQVAARNANRSVYSGTDLRRT